MPLGMPPGGSAAMRRADPFGLTRQIPCRFGLPVHKATYKLPARSRTMPVVSAGAPVMRLRTGQAAPPVGSGSWAKMRTWPASDTRATWAASANVTSAEPSGSRARFSGVWPRLKSRWAMMRGLLTGPLAAAAGAATVSRHAAAATARPRRPRADLGCRWPAARGALRRIGLAKSFITVVPFVAPGSGELGVAFRSAPGQLAASFSDPSRRLRERGPVKVDVLSVKVEPRPRTVSASAKDGLRCLKRDAVLITAQRQAGTAPAS